MALLSSPPAPARPTSSITDAPASRRIIGQLGRHSALPPGRAVVGALLITVAAVITFAAYTATSGGPTGHLVVARSAIDAGHRLEVSDLQLVAADLPPDVGSQVFTEVGQLDGAVTLAPLDAGTPVSRAGVSTAEVASHTSAREFSFSVDRDHALDGQLQRGETIDLVATFGTGTDARTTIVAQRIRVLSVGSSSPGGVGSNGRITIVVELDSQHDVLQAAHAVEVAKVSVIRSTRADPGTDDQSIAGSTTSGTPTDTTRGSTPTTTAASHRGAADTSTAGIGAPPVAPTTTGATAVVTPSPESGDVTDVAPPVGSQP